MSTEKEESNSESAVIFHTHSRLDTLISQEEAELESEKHDSLSSVEALTWFAVQQSSDSNILICDTDHPVHVLDRKGFDRVAAYAYENIEQTIKVINMGVLERVSLLQNTVFSKNIVTGIEADILNVDGKLDVGDEVLSELEIAIASLHPSYWQILNGSLPNSKQWTEVMAKVALNSHIDVLGHPFRNYLKIVGDSFDLQHWEQVADALIKSGVAFEINLLDLERDKDEFWFKEKIISLMVKRGVNLIFGLDFHEFNDYGARLPRDLFINVDTVKKFYTEGICSANLLSQFTNKGIIRILQQLGISSDMFVNSSQKTFFEWRKSR